MTTDRDLRNQLLYAIKTNDLDALAGVIADMIYKGYERGFNCGQKLKAKEIARKMLAEGVSEDDVTAFTGISVGEL